MVDTIFALSSAPGRGGVAVVRVSGPVAVVSARAICQRDLVAREASYCHLVDPVSCETIDRGVAIHFSAPASYTGEDVVEYYVHGGRAVVDGLLACLGAQDGHRMAEPGEFTRRAFENGKLDLTEAEAVADLIDAQTQAQKNQALAQLSGQLSQLYHDWSERLKNMLAYIEADIEFPDEDLPDGIEREIKPKVRDLLTEIKDHLSDNRRGERLRDGVQVVVIGAPNVGKSSLVNALAQRDVAIVSDVAGTTRDVIEVHLDLDGYPVTLVDTAGLRPEHMDAGGHDAIENEGMRRALERAQNADLKLLVFDGTQDMADPETLQLIDEHSVLLVNKADEDLRLDMAGACSVSAQTGAGFDDFMKVLLVRVQDLIGTQEAPVVTRQRHRRALEECLMSLRRSLDVPLPELMAEDLRLAMKSIARITGRVDAEDLLDTIFADFCIGK